MKFRMDETLRFWVDCSYENKRDANPDRPGAELITEILREYERSGDAMRCLNAKGQIAWKAHVAEAGRCGTRGRGRYGRSSVKLAADISLHLARSKGCAEDPVPYSKEALRQDLARVRLAWEDCQASRDRNAIYGYLSAVFELAAWWAAEDRAISRARWVLRSCRLDLPNDEPFAVIIFCTSDLAKVDKRTRSKWSRVLRYAAEYKSHRESLAAFVQHKGGINKCAERFTRCLGLGGKIEG